MAILELEVPEDVYLALQAAGLDRTELGVRASRDLAIQLYSEGRLSLGKAAKLAGLQLPDFGVYLMTTA